MKKLDRIVSFGLCLLCGLPWVVVVFAWITKPPKNDFYAGPVIVISAVALLLEGLLLLAFLSFAVTAIAKDMRYAKAAAPRWAAFLILFAISFYCAMVINRYTGL